MKIPELLAPAGDLERLITAVNYGADAVYIGGLQYGLRANARNFSDSDMEAGISYAHKRGRKVYVTANIFAHDDDIDGMAPFFEQLYEMGVDAAIVSDPGVFALAREAAPKLPLHISTQANTTNYRAVSFWHGLGASRVILARELSIDQIAGIRRRVPPGAELEVFVHGAMCVSMSGRCLLSNYMTAKDSTHTRIRDANKGDCSQPCRWKYYLTEETRPGEFMPVYEDGRGTYIYNSKDLCLAAHIPALTEAGVASLKIEGRMKTPYYVAVTVKTYRRALDDYASDPAKYAERVPQYIEELTKASHRSFTTGFALSRPDEWQQVYGSSSYIRTHEFVGVVQDFDESTGFATIEQRGKFSVGECVEAFPCVDESFRFTIDEMFGEDGEPITSAPHAQQIVRLKPPRPLHKHDMLRKEVTQ
ncbi:MAG: U32 family peptidase [Defluviitaleaceae bacterium]|nr:U32 family peptidase [Defluviitaleaceae bacterium]